MHQVAQQAVLGRRELDLPIRAPDAVGIVVEHDVADRHAGPLVGLPAPATQHRLDAQDQLFQAERLGQVVVAAAGEPLAQIGRVVAGGEEDHRHVVPRLAQFAAEGEPVETRQVDVEHEDVPGVVAGQGQPFRTGRRGLDGEPGEAQRGGDEVANRLLVFDEQDALFTRVPIRACTCSCPTSSSRWSVASTARSPGSHKKLTPMRSLRVKRLS